MSFPTKLTNNGHDFAYGVGLKLGLHKELSDTLCLGVMYQTEIDMTEFDDYADLFAHDGDLDVPADFKIGLTCQARENVAVSYDIEHTWFGDVDAAGNPISNIFSCPTVAGMDLASCLGGDRGDQPIAPGEVLFIILAPATIENHLTLGLTRDNCNHREWNFSFMYTSNTSVSGPNPFDPTQTITLEMDQFELEFSYGWKF